MDDFERRIRFFVESDKMKYILRRTYTGDGSRYENDAEHSFSLALLCLIMEPYAPNGVDMERVLRMAVLHDLVEIYAGDSYVYDACAMASKTERESASAERLYGILPEGQGAEMEALWREFDEEQTLSARFCACMDHFQPLFENFITGGKSWMEHGVCEKDVRNRILMMKDVCERLYEYCAHLIDRAVEAGWLKTE